MMARNFGQIFNTISIAGVEPSDMWGIYSASKYAVRGFTESLRKRLLKTKIKVMGFYPESMNTNIFKAAGFNFSNDEPWMMKVEDVSKIILFMLQQPSDINLDHVQVRKIE